MSNDCKSVHLGFMSIKLTICCRKLSDWTEDGIQTQASQSSSGPHSMPSDSSQPPFVYKRPTRRTQRTEAPKPAEATQAPKPFEATEAPKPAEAAEADELEKKPRSLPKLMPPASPFGSPPTAVTATVQPPAAPAEPAPGVLPYQCLC